MSNLENIVDAFHNNLGDTTEFIMDKDDLEKLAAHNHPIDYKTPKKSAMLIEGEKLLDKINILTTKPENTSSNTKLPTIKDFVIIKPISRGAFGKVFLGYKNNDHCKLFAIKVMRKSEMINKNMVSQVITERNALALSRSPFCVSLFYSLQSISYVYLVMEYMVGGDLKSLLAMYGYLDEAAARFYVAEVALALQYLHQHGITHRDIKPDNMLISATGHVKLTDFGLSKIETRKGERDLEISDLINCSPNLNTRTPGQLLSLTSHLSFGSERKIECGTGVSNFVNIINKHTVMESSDSEADTSLNDVEKANDSKISGVSPFFSAEEINISIAAHHTCSNNMMDSSSSYHTCASVADASKLSPPTDVSNGNTAASHHKRVEFVDNNNLAKVHCNGCKNDSAKGCDKENIYNKNLNKVENTDDTSFEFSMMRRRSIDERNRSSKPQEDSGVSSRKSDYSNSNINGEFTVSSIDKAENLCNSREDYSCSDYSKSYNINNTNEISGIRMQSPFRNVSRNFKRPELQSSSFRGMKRKINLINRSENNSSMDMDGCYGSASTGLTQEIDIMDIGSSTPKKRKSKSSPIRGVLKVRSLSDDDMPQMMNDNVANVVFSTPVSSQKLPRRDGGLLGKLKSTRFALPLSVETNKREQTAEKSSGVQYLKMAQDDPTMSPINLNTNSMPKTPKKVNTPFRTPKSVRRGGRQSSERILGTPDYLAPELLLKQGHGPAVDWWALGVCFYEFLTGIPPFNDETPQKVFDNILNKKTNKREQTAEKSSGVQYLKMAQDDPTMSPINLNTNSMPKTPKKVNTPFRTPKSVRRGGRQSSERILGTPDYLAPELLLKQGHGPAVDWWALGVCFYEFLTGIPPFNDETPQKVFDNILNKNIEWPEGDEVLSPAAVEAVQLLLTMDPSERPAAKEVQQMQFFSCIDWENLEKEEPPFVPAPENPTDTGYFEARNNLQHLKLSNFAIDE